MGRIAVVGGGIIGTAIARRLSDRNESVVLFEKGRVGNATTAASIGVFSWQEHPPTELGQRVRRRAWDHYEAMVSDGQVGFETCGGLTLAGDTDTRADLERAADALREYGLTAAVYSPADAGTLGFEPSALGAGLYTSDEGYFDPPAVARHFADRAEAAGAEIRTDTAVTDIEVDGDGVGAVTTDTGSVTADHVVNAAGPWAPRIDDMVGLSHPLSHARAPILVLPTDTPTEHPFTLFDNDVYCRGTGEERLLVGFYDTTYRPDTLIGPGQNPTPGPEFRRKAIETIEPVVPGITTTDPVKEWVGLRTVTPDGYPLVGPTPLDGYTVAVGMNGLGVTLAPAVADVVAATLTESEPELDGLASALAPGRVAE